MITVEIRFCVNDDEDDAHCLAGARCHHVCYGLMVGGKLHAGGVEGEGGCIWGQAGMCWHYTRSLGALRVSWLRPLCLRQTVWPMPHIYLTKTSVRLVSIWHAHKLDEGKKNGHRSNGQDDSMSRIVYNCLAVWDSWENLCTVNVSNCSSQWAAPQPKVLKADGLNMPLNHWRLWEIFEICNLPPLNISASWLLTHIGMRP